MKSPGKTQTKKVQESKASGSDGNDHGRIVSLATGDECLDTTQLNQLEQSFREWAEDSRRSDVRLSRQRILLIFLLIRYTGAKLSEVLALNPFEDIDWIRHTVVFRGSALDPREADFPSAVQRNPGYSGQSAISARVGYRAQPGPRFCPPQVLRAGSGLRLSQAVGRPGDHPQGSSRRTHAEQHAVTGGADDPGAFDPQPHLGLCLFFERRNSTRCQTFHGKRVFAQN